ncbi:hypothetical protein Q3G72_005473 [Acer saccharum]|nr:hypothetical protein Q3G72_005473 [Acer saccharum]
MKSRGNSDGIGIEKQRGRKRFSGEVYLERDSVARKRDERRRWLRGRQGGVDVGGRHGGCQHSNPSFAKFLLRRRHYPISAANLPTDTIVASPFVRCSSTRNGVIVEATKATRSSDPVRMGSSAAEATTGRSKAAATVAVRWWWRLWQQGCSKKFFSPSGRCP